MKMRNFCAVGLWVSLWMVVSCGEVDDKGGVAMGREALVAVSFRVNPEQMSGGAQSASSGGECVDGRQMSRSILNPGTDTDEGTALGYVPRDVWVIQYNGVGDEALLSGLPRYVEFSGPVNIQAVASSTDNTLVFVANTHDPNIDWGNISSLGLFKQACKRIERESDCYGNNFSAHKDLVLSGKYVGVINTGAISVELLRNIVRLDFTIVNAPSSAMTLKTVQLCNVPRGFYYGAAIMPKGIVFPVISDHFNYPEETITTASAEASEQTFTFYMPANAQGVNPASTTSKTKPIHAPGFSSYIRIMAQSAQGKAYAYKIYPGANMINDYNLSANHRYQIKIVINSSGDASTDGRVQDYGQVDFVSANSFILNPAPMGTVQRVYSFPISKVNHYWPNVDPSLTISDGDSWTAELLWQDTPTSDFIRFIDPITGLETTTLHGSGPAQRIVLTTKSGYRGNALIALKKDSRVEVGYLWSWHLWVTDYDPHYKATPMAKQYVYSVTQGAVHQYDGQAWTDNLLGHYRTKYIMDRNLGARDADFTTAGALYYQFGRKDPLPCDSGNKLYDINGNALSNTDPRNSARMNKNAGEGVTIATAVLNPTFFYYMTPSSDHGDWAVDGRSGTYAWNNTIAGLDIKSLFDPCPTGWRLPLQVIWSDFVYNPTTPALSTTLDVNRDPRLGWEYGGASGARYWPLNLDVTGSVYYPALGLRNLYSGEIGGAPAYGYVWSAVPFNERTGHNISFGSAYMGIAQNSRIYGFSVRCVQE